MSNILILFLLSCVTGAAQAGHFLFWAPVACEADYILMRDIGQELAKRGHEATLVGGYKYSTKNEEGIKEIVINSTFDKMIDALLGIGQLQKRDDRYRLTVNTVIDSNRNALTHPQVVDLMKTKHVDVLIALPELGAPYFLAQKKNASLVLFTRSMRASPLISWANGDTYNPSYMKGQLMRPYDGHPLYEAGSNTKLTFRRRLTNSILTVVKYFLDTKLALPQLRRMLAEEFPDESIPQVDDFFKDTALTISNDNPFLSDGPRPVMPKTLLAGMMNCKSKNQLEPLPNELKDWVEGAEHGVILVSFGSVLQLHHITEEKRQLLVSVFGRLKQRIIWKMKKPISNAPNNTLLYPWLPQQSLLAHDNVKLFITHGGAGSFQEAICHKTPIVGIPFVEDQFLNVDEATRKHIGVHVNFDTMTEESLANSINEVLNNTRQPSLN